MRRFLEGAGWDGCMLHEERGWARDGMEGGEGESDEQNETD